VQDLDDLGPVTIEVTSSDLLPPATDSDRAELFKFMAFQADKRVKELEGRIEELKHLAKAADNELAHLQREIACGGAKINHACGSMISNARAALTRLEER